MSLRKTGEKKTNPLKGEAPPQAESQEAGALIFSRY